jgi:hypothetical protein
MGTTNDYSAMWAGLNHRPCDWNADMVEIEYPDDHPHSTFQREQIKEYETQMAEFAAGIWEPRWRGQTRPYEPSRHNSAFRVPAPGKTGIPNRRDVVGRFLCGLKGESGSFKTDGERIYSFGTHWIMVERDARTDEIRYTEKMFEKPYSGYTSQHMSAVSRDPRIAKLVVNAEEWPRKVVEAVEDAIVRATKDLRTVAEFGDAIYGAAGYHAGSETREAMIRGAFPVAKRLIARGFRRERERLVRDRSLYLKQYTKASVDAMIAYYETASAFYVDLVDEYEKRHFKEYGDRSLGPIPTRKAPKKPGLEAKKRSSTSASTRAKGVLAWHFVDTSLRLGYGDNRPVEIGGTLSVETRPDPYRDGGIALCNYGLHGSKTIGQASGYYGERRYLCRTLHFGAMDVGTDKLASEHRQVLGIIDMYSEAGKTIHDAIRGRAAGMADKMALAMLGMEKDRRTVGPTEIVATLPDGLPEEIVEAFADKVPF